MAMMDLFKTIIIVQLFFSFAITLMAYALPNESLNYVTDFTQVGNNIDMETVRNDIEGGVTNELGIPVIEMGALIFYSGNLIIDLLLNFFFAIPEMIGLLMHGFATLFVLDAFIVATMELFAGVIVTVLYFIGLIQLLLGIRSGRSIV